MNRGQEEFWDLVDHKDAKGVLNAVGKIEVGNGLEKKRARLFLILMSALCCFSASVATEGFSSPVEIGRDKKIVMPVARPIPAQVTSRTNETIGPRNFSAIALANASEEAKFQEYILGGNVEQEAPAFKGILPGLLTLQSQLEAAKFDDFSHIPELRRLVQELVGRTQKVAESSDPWDLKYHQIKSWQPEVVNQLEQIGGRAALRLVNLLRDFRWPDEL